MVTPPIPPPPFLSPITLIVLYLYVSPKFLVILLRAKILKKLDTIAIFLIFAFQAYDT